MKMMKDHYIDSQQCIVYLETYYKTQDGGLDAYIDFRLQKDLKLFESIMDSPHMHGSLVELHSLKSSKRLRVGCYYKLNLNLLKSYHLKRTEDSLLIGASVDLSSMSLPKDEMTELLQCHDILDPKETSMVNIPIESNFNLCHQQDFTLFVKNVGQANWNELRCGDDVVVVYDAGAELHATSKAVRQIFDSRIKALQRSKPVLVISHWDMDHIHCLKSLSLQEIKGCFSKIICPDRLKTITARKILKDFTTALGAANVYCLPLPTRTNGTTMHHWKTIGRISLYCGEKSSNANYCGLLMFVDGFQKSASYTGDCRLTQAKYVYDKEIINVKTNYHVLIAPHHGGDYGAKFRKYSPPCNLIIVSVCNNNYGHPHKDMIEYLKSLGTIETTMNMGDITIKL